MTRSHLIPLIAVSLLSPASAETLIWSDNFNTGRPQDTLDGAPLTGRRSGTEAENIIARSSQVQHASFADQIYMWASGGRMRFHRDPNIWCDFAALSSAPAILSAGGLCVEFDIPNTLDSTPGNWVGFAIGHSGPAIAEPGVRVTEAATDYGVMIGKDGKYSRYGNSSAIGEVVDGSAAITRHVKLEYVFNSFADGTPVIAKTTISTTTNGVVNSQVISYDSFTWNGNGGELYMELENRGGNTYIDNVKFSTATVYGVELLTEEFRSGTSAGTLAGSFSGKTLQNETGLEDSTFTLVAGEGDTDNSKFTIDSSGQLLTGSYDFKLGPAGTVYSIRVQGTGTQSGLTSQKVFTVIPIKDDDMDFLPDDWELSFPGNTSLSNLTGLASGPGPGAGTGDFDGDGIDDLGEYGISRVTPGYSPIVLDSDGDGIDDYEEENPNLEGRVITSAVRADTDRDGLWDLAEYNAGTNPVLADTDGDGSRDGFEIDRGSDPDDDASRPELPVGFALVPLTDDASSGISTAKTYTHRISGGAAATVNNVVFDVLTTTATPANFAWTVNGGKAAATAPNLGNWVAANGGVTGSGLQALYGTFTYAGVNDGAIQTYELSNLIPGQTYQVKLFIRKFSDGSLRDIDLTYTNGSDVQVPFGPLLYDRPGVVLSNDNNNSVYYVSYSYVAQGTTLKITAANSSSALADSGSAHFYGLTNEVVPTPGSDLKILGVSRGPSGSVTINFSGAADTAYQVTKSPDLSSPFVALAIPLSVTTDAGGAGVVVVPAAEASETKGFYRIEN
ncbi:hypothetical protein [Luteolibacter sp. Populi]|uniref:hypothetical protein n=1 Tax=Luteolibacter sp. Populi TaxID=3230487 RepID=UPI0034664A0C